MTDEDIKKTKSYDKYMEYELVEGRLYKKEQELISKASVAGTLTKKYSDLIKAENKFNKSWKSYSSVASEEAERMVKELSNKQIYEEDFRFANNLELEIFQLIGDSLKED